MYIFKRIFILQGQRISAVCAWCNIEKKTLKAGTIILKIKKGTQTGENEIFFIKCCIHPVHSLRDPSSSLAAGPIQFTRCSIHPVHSLQHPSCSLAAASIQFTRCSIHPVHSLQHPSSSLAAASILFTRCGTHPVHSLQHPSSSLAAAPIQFTRCSTHPVHSIKQGSPFSANKKFVDGKTIGRRLEICLSNTALNVRSKWPISHEVIEALFPCEDPVALALFGTTT